MRAILVEQPTVDSVLSMRFARAPYVGFVQEDGSVAFEPNPFAAARGGAGPQFVSWLADHGVNEVISAAVPGVNAEAALRQMGIVHKTVNGTVRDVLGGNIVESNNNPQVYWGASRWTNGFWPGYGRWGLRRWFGGFGFGRGWGRGCRYGRGYGRGWGRGRGFGGRGRGWGW